MDKYFDFLKSKVEMAKNDYTDSILGMETTDPSHPVVTKENAHLFMTDLSKVPEADKDRGVNYLYGKFFAYNNVLEDYAKYQSI